MAKPDHALVAFLGTLLVVQVGAGTAGQFIPLMPVFGSVLAIVFLGEQLFWFHVLGALAIGGGIYLSVTQLSARADKLQQD